MYHLFRITSVCYANGALSPYRIRFITAGGINSNRICYDQTAAAREHLVL
ncbi:hypothetical protein [Methanimicrococcus blatticola]|nr:hypothetical protein [Methanimicrococcus blatticola]MBZ3935382.1 hypothetical protein [Methanimicrococcus blatticola]MCC2508520.1 hypothetical protein [Methanimicrococcus blatticola]